MRLINISVFNYLTYNSNLHESFVGALDPRTKLFLSISLSSILIFNRNSLILLSVFIIIISVQIGLVGYKRFLQTIYMLRWSIFVIFTISVIVNSFNQDLLLDRILSSSVLVLRVIGITFSFSIFNQTTSPDLLYDSLIKLKIPKRLAWVIVISYRQAIFYIDEFSNLFHGLSVQTSNPIRKIIRIVKDFVKILVIAYVRAIIRSREFAHTLKVRGFSTIHENISLYSTKLRIPDYCIILLIIIIDIISFLN
jgi:energy-coupling factor transporter transmembrane protein EcfT